MLILYNKAARKNLSKPKEAAKWYPVLRSTGMLKEREVPKLIADKTTLNPKEAIARIDRRKLFRYNSYSRFHAGSSRSQHLRRNQQSYK